MPARIGAAPLPSGRGGAPSAGRRAVAAVLAGLLLGVSGGAAATLVGPAPAHAETIREAQWWLDAIQVLKAQQVAKGDGVVVAVIDTGVDAKHPDLAGALVPGAGLNGSTSAQGFDDPVGHGSQMASVIAGRGGDGPNHVLGIAPKAKILPIAIPMGENGVAPANATGSNAEPIRYAVDHGAKIINMSFAVVNGQAKQPEIDAIAYARSKGVIVVAAGGNSTQGDQKVPFPGAYPGVITVGGTDRDGNLWEGSLQDATVDIAAPAQDIVGAGSTTVTKSGYVRGSGTSGATAIVSGVLALIWSKYPSLDAANVINRLFKTAVDKGPPGRDDRFGNGLVNPLAAVTANVPAVNADPLGPITAGQTSTEPTPGATTPGGGSFGTPVIRAAIVVGAVLLSGLVLALLIALPARAAARRRARAGATGPARFPPGMPGPPGVAGPPGVPGPPGMPGVSGAPGQAGPPGAPPGYGQRPPSGYPMPPGGAPPTGWQPPVGSPPPGGPPGGPPPPGGNANPPTSPTGFRPPGTAAFPATGQQPPAPPGTGAFPATGQQPPAPPANPPGT